MKKLGFFFLLLLVCQSCIVICKGGKDKVVAKSNYERVSGKGQIVEKEITHSGFDKLSLFAPIKVKVLEGETYDVKVSGHENLVSLLNIEMKNKTLKINTEKNYEFTDDVKVLIQIPVSLQKMDIGSLCQASIGEIVDQNKFELNASGVSDRKSVV